MDALNFRLVQYKKLYDGEKQEDASECLMMLIEKYIVCVACWLRPPHSSLVAWYMRDIYYAYLPMQEEHLACRI